MPRVTHIFKTYFPYTSGGLEEAVRQCAAYAAGNGFDVEVVSVGPADTIFQGADGVKARFFKKTGEVLSNPFSLSLAREFGNICRRTDLLHFHFPWPTAELLALAWQSRIPLLARTPSLVTFHCDIHRSRMIRPLYMPFVRRFLRRMDRICVTSRPLFLNTDCLRPFEKKVLQIPLFMNENRFAGLGAPDPAVTGFLEPQKPFALFVGVLRWYKGLDVLLDAARHTTGRIVIVGTGPLYEHLAARIRALNMSHVHLLGFQEDATLEWLIRHAAMIVLPSVSPAEAFGQVLLEGLYFGRPLVSTELGTGTSVVNRHKHTGLVVRPGCCLSLAAAMNTLFADPDLAKQMGRNARQHYLAQFTPRHQGERYLSVYRDLLYP
jgi:O-antigen biosynthesis alpha-1,3-mannosyltransferase